MHKALDESKVNLSEKCFNHASYTFTTLATPKVPPAPDHGRGGRSRRALALAVTIQVSRYRKRFKIVVAGQFWLGTFGCTSVFQSVSGTLW